MALASNALTTLQVVKDALGITDASKDALLERAINAASSSIEGFCGRIFGKATVTENLPGSWGPRIILSRIPLVSITTVKIDGTLLESTDYSIDSADAGSLYRSTGWPRLFASLSSIESSPIPGTEKNWIEVVYVGGYVLPKDTSPNTPADLEQACIDTAISIYRQRKDDRSIIEERLGDASVKYSGDRPLIPDAVKQLLLPYLRLIR